LQFKTKEKIVGNVKQRDVCRMVLDRNEVLADQIATLILESVGNEVSNESLKDLIVKIKAETTKSSNSTVDAIINLFK